MRMFTFFPLFTLFLLCYSIPVPGQEEKRLPSVFEHLAAGEMPKVHLEIDLDALVGNRKNADYLPATLTEADGQVWKLEVRTRGKFRRRRCEIPPLKFKFQKEELKAGQLDTFNEIKLVLPCAAQAASEDLIVREYVAYRMFETLSPVSARARLVKLELKNSKKKRPQKMLAMLVEHEEEIAARFRSTPVQEWGLPAERFQTDQVAMMILFQYMIGNTDWELESCRNILVLQPNDNGKLLTVPFDFDFSGLVSAPYSSPNSAMGLRTVQDRCLMAKGFDKEIFQQAKEKILAAKPDLMDWCKHPLLSAEATEHMKWFMGMFFDQMNGNAEIPDKIEAEKK